MNKTISFAIVHFFVAFSVGYVLSGDILVGGAIALVEPLINTFAYHLHELFWAKKTHMPGKHQNIMVGSTKTLVATE